MTVITAMTKRIWIKPPTTGNTKNPSNHNTNKTKATVYNILSFLPFIFQHISSELMYQERKNNSIDRKDEKGTT
jgi:hypothetical protein